MRKLDRHITNILSLVIGILVAIAILLIVLAKFVGGETQLEHIKADSLQLAAVEDRTRPFARVAVAGQDNAALEVVADSGGSPAAAGLPVPQSAEELYNAACSACHGQGIAGAPRMGDKAAWAPRIAKGKDILYMHSLEGFQGQTGLMPPKGGRVDLPDELVRQGVDYMIDGSR